MRITHTVFNIQSSPSRKLRFPDFMKMAQDGGRFSALRTGRFYPPGNASGRARLKRDGTCAETRFCLSAERTSPFESAEGGVSSVDCWQPRCAHQR
jgi:hypothetical protein